MNAILLPSPHRRPVSPVLKPTIAVGKPANDRVLAGYRHGEEPEAVLDIAFVGLDPAEQRLALASFPGGRRCAIAES